MQSSQEQSRNEMATNGHGTRPTTWWKKRMTLSQRDLMLDDVDPSEELHMLVAGEETDSGLVSSPPSLAARRASMPAPCFRREESLLVVDLGRLPKRPSCFPKYRVTEIQNREDLEKRLESFRNGLDLLDFSEQCMLDESGRMDFKAGVAAS